LSETIEAGSDTDLDEMCVETNEKKYSNRCDVCDFKVEVNRKYELIQIILKHKELCSSRKMKSLSKHKTCTVCDFVATNGQHMKRHNRDEHNILNGSTSPPPKKTKVSPVNINDISEEMEIVDNEEEECVKDLSFKLEDMDIDTVNSDEDDDKSRLMDEKIRAREKRIEEEVRLHESKLKNKEMKKKQEEELKMERLQKLNKKRKQQVKDEKKKRRRKETPKNKSERAASKIPNVVPVPQNCVHLVNKGDMVYTVPGDGKCGPSSASAFLFEDEIFGGKLRRNMNIFMAKNWKRRYQYITQCSEKHPFIRKLAGGQVKFEDPLQLVEYLLNSEEAVNMWSDSEDLSVISDMYQVKIKVITTKGESDKNPTVNWIVPEKTLKEHAELKGVELDDMVLLHEHDTHFNLIVSKDSNLATLGSLSYRTNIGPMVEEVKDEETNSKEEETHSEDEEEDMNDVDGETSMESVRLKEIKDLKKELKKVNESKKAIEVEFTKCELELKNKTEEVAKMATEIKDLKQIIELEGLLKDVDDDTNSEGSNKDVEYVEILKKTKSKKMKNNIIALNVPSKELENQSL
jgi:hypothetical protein